MIVALILARRLIARPTHTWNIKGVDTNFCVVYAWSHQRQSIRVHLGVIKAKKTHPSKSFEFRTVDSGGIQTNQHHTNLGSTSRIKERRINFNISRCMLAANSSSWKTPPKDLDWNGSILDTRYGEPSELTGSETQQHQSEFSRSYFFGVLRGLQWIQHPLWIRCCKRWPHCTTIRT